MSNIPKYGLLLLAVVLAIKAILFVWAYSQFDFATYPTETALSIWDRWDSKAYTTIATEGYNSKNVAPDYRAFLSHFPPTYPTVISLVSSITFLSVRDAAMLVSLLAILAASYLLYRLVFSVSGNLRLAFLSALLLNLYPTSYFTIAPYTESLFILLIIASFYVLYKYPKYSYLAGLMGAAAVLTRLLGIALVPAFIWFVWNKHSKKREASSADMVSDILLIFFPMFAAILYLGINKYYFGNPLYFLQEYAVNPYSAKTLSLPLTETFQSIISIIQNATRGIWDPFLMSTTGWNSLFTLFVLIVTIIGFFKRIRREWIVFALSYILLFSSFRWGLSNARYSFAVFPIFIVLAGIKNKVALYAVGVCFIALLLYFTRLYTSGAWAF